MTQENGQAGEEAHKQAAEGTAERTGLVWSAEVEPVGGRWARREASEGRAWLWAALAVLRDRGIVKAAREVSTETSVTTDPLQLLIPVCLPAEAECSPLCGDWR